jgi:tRNA (adenine22-N1)-methyltransferase
MVSDRIKSISSLINRGEEIIDIGCDHGLLDVYLVLNGLCKCHCCDVNQGIINRAIFNFKKYNVYDFIDIFVGNGFDQLNLPSNFVMVLSGMGTSTILKILSNNKTDSIICQTNTDLYALRKNVCDMGYYISAENLVFDNNRFYISIRFEKGNVNYSYDELLLGPCLLRDNPLLFHKYVENIYKKNIGAYIKSLEFNCVDFDLEMMINCLNKYI